MTDLAIDTSVKMAVLGMVAWLATRRAGLAQALMAHSAWLAVIVTSIALPCFSLSTTPSMAIVPSRALAGLVPTLGPDITRWLAAAYLGGAAVLALRLGLGLRQIRTLRRDAQLVLAADDREEALVRACAADGAILMETDAISTPATAGAWRPVVFLPTGWRALDRGVIAAIVAHELAHVRRHGYATTVAGRIVRVIFWFHPVAWLACARLRWFEELACDRAVSRADPLQYAKALLAVARLSARRAPGLALSGGSRLADRVEQLLSQGQSAGATPLALAVAALGIAVVSWLPFVTFRVSGAPAGSAVGDHETTHARRHAAHPH